jgi:predicted MPP superfamily phosphohydrolase
MMKFLHLTDTHLLHSKKIEHKTHAYQTITELTEQLIKLKQLEDLSALDFIVLTGDMVYEGTEEDYVLLFDLLKEQFNEMPLYVTLGNHDNRAAFFNAMKPEVESEGNYLDYAVETENCHLIFLDTSETDKHGADLQPSQIDWLQAELRKNNQPKVIFSHHPLIIKNDGLVVESNEYPNILEDHEIMGLFAGHIHNSTTKMNDQYLSHTAESTCFGLTIDAADRLFFNNRTGYSLVTIENSTVNIEPRLIFPNSETKKETSYEEMTLQIKKDLKVKGRV